MLETSVVEVMETQDGRYMQEAHTGQHWFTIDEPEALGGDDAGPGPYEYLLAALGACTSMTLRMYAERKKWPLDRVHVRLTHRRIHAEDCADCPEQDRMLDEISREIFFKGDLSQAQQLKLVDVAGRCPVAQTLSRGTKLRALLAQESWQSSPWEAEGG